MFGMISKKRLLEEMNRLKESGCKRRAKFIATNAYPQRLPHKRKASDLPAVQSEQPLELIQG